jgi:Icc-related predicted phosphoesterase
MEITFISDTHWLVRDAQDCRDMNDLLPGGPILVHAGDVSGRGTESEIRKFLDWFSKLPYTHKILISGNHDFFFEVAKPDEVEALIAEYPGITYLNDNGVTIEGIKFWGSPVTPFFHNWAFNRWPNEIKPHWDLIPEGIDVLITHGPPRGILDFTEYDRDHVGCPTLLDKVKQIKPKVHVFGHIHEARGKKEIDGTVFINASMVTLRYELRYETPYTVDVEPNSQTLV